MYIDQEKNANCFMFNLFTQAYIYIDFKYMTKSATSF